MTASQSSKSEKNYHRIGILLLSEYASWFFLFFLLNYYFPFRSTFYNQQLYLQNGLCTAFLLHYLNPTDPLARICQTSRQHQSQGGSGNRLCGSQWSICADSLGGETQCWGQGKACFPNSQSPSIAFWFF